MISGSPPVQLRAFTSEQLHDIAERAATLYERLATRPRSGPVHDHDEVIERRLLHWQQACASGDPEGFAQRLAHEDLDLATARPLLCDRVGAARAPLEEWAWMLDACIAASAEPARPEQLLAGLTSARDPLAFEDLWSGFLLYAVDRLKDRVPALREIVTPEALANLARSLLRAITSVTATSMYLEFSLYRTSRASAFSQLLRGERSEGERGIYDEFVRGMRSGGLVDFFLEYTLLARFTGTLVIQWIDAAAEMLERVAEDLTGQPEHVAPWPQPGRVVAVDTGLSDRHHDGRMVSILTFESGLRLVYKPRSLAMEEAFFDVVQWINRQGLSLRLRPLAVFNRGTYGWMEYAQSASLDSEQSARRYFHRLGMYVCLIHALGGNDYHWENIIASGEHPLLVDIETLGQPELVTPIGESDTSARAYATRSLADSVLGTGFLPRWRVDPADHVFEVSGAGGVDEQSTSYRQPVWTDVNSDAMTLRTVDGRVTAPANLPVRDGHRLDPADFQDALEAGFTEMYRCVIEHAEELLAPGSPLRAFARLESRVLLRSTVVYGLLLKQTLHPQYCRHGLDASIEWDALSRGYLGWRQPTALWSTLQAEHAALIRLDVPYFSVPLDGTRLTCDNGLSLQGCVAQSGFDRIRERIAGYDEAGLAREVHIIRSSFHARTAAGMRENQQVNRPLELRESRQVDGPAELSTWDEAPLLSETELIDQAIDLAGGLEREAIRAGDAATWAALDYDPRIDRYRLRALQANLYSGTVGIALFLAALERRTSAGYEGLAMAAVADLRRWVHEDPDEMLRRYGLGGMVGMPSVCYGLLRMGELLERGELIDDAVSLSKRITAEAIGEDTRLDVLSGVAGALLVLLHLHELTGRQQHLDLAVACGERLIATAVKGAEGWRWRTMGERPLTGFSHGAAGIGYALHRLGEAARSSRYSDAASRAIEFERSLYSADAGNWPDLRSPREDEAQQFMTSWCHGATGIGLSRLVRLRVDQTGETRAEVEAALRATLRHPALGMDGLCCGHVGRADFLYMAGRVLSNPALQGEATRRVSWVGLRATAGRARYFANLPPGVPSYGLLVGAAGVGYALLRVTDTQGLVPAVLLLG